MMLREIWHKGSFRIKVSLVFFLVLVGMILGYSLYLQYIRFMFYWNIAFH